MIINWPDEKALWAYLEPRLRGSWRRLELSYPYGLCDSVGLWEGSTIWLEHKVGPPSPMAFMPQQIVFANDCMRHRVPWWCCFGHKGVVKFYPGLDLDEPRVPPFWVPPSVVLADVVRRSRRTGTEPDPSGRSRARSR